MPRAYADVVGNFRRGEAGAYARGGDYRRAAGALTVDDPEMAAAYRREADAQEQTAYRRDYGQDYASGNYDAAAARAGKFGDMQGVAAAREGQTEAQQQARIQLWRGAQQSLAELDAIEQAQGQGYDAYLARAREAAGNPNVPEEIRAFAQSLPDQWNPRVTGYARNFVSRLRDNLLTPEQAAQLEIRRENQANEGWSLDAYGRPYQNVGGIIYRRNEAGDRVQDTNPVPVPRDRIETAATESTDTSGEGQLRREWVGSQREFIAVRDSYQQIRQLSAGQVSPSDHIGLVFSFMKMLDPTSAVRETEYANAQNAAGVPERVRNTWNRLRDGRFLDDNQVRDFVTTANSVYTSRLQQYRSSERQYRGIAESYGYDPTRVIVSLADASAEEGGDDSGDAGGALPPVAQRVVGEVYTLPRPGPNGETRGRWNGPGRGFTPVQE